MFGITYETWKKICDMYFSLGENTKKSYLQWFPFSKLDKDDEKTIASAEFYEKYIQNGGFVFFPEVMSFSENYIQKADGSFRNASLVSPLLYMVIQSLGRELYLKYSSQRPVDMGVYYAGNYEYNRANYKTDYDTFYKDINYNAEKYPYYIKTDITNFFESININKLIDRLNTVCNNRTRKISQTQLMVTKELLKYCGDGIFPLIENSMASSYLATVVYLDQIDCDLHEYLRTKVTEIQTFRMIRYVDDMYILFSSNIDPSKLNQIFNTVINEYSSILKPYGLTLNVGKCTCNRSVQIGEDLKKSLYDEIVYEIRESIGDFFHGKIQGFLEDIYSYISTNELTNATYNELIEKHFQRDDIEFTPTEVFNYLTYENQTEIKTPEVSKAIVKILKTDVSILSIDPKRLTALVIRSGDNKTVKTMLNELFVRNRMDIWNSYDTTIAINYLIQCKFQHKDLLNVLFHRNIDLYSYYLWNCKDSFLNYMNKRKPNRYLMWIDTDTKAVFLYFMSVCEEAKLNHLTSYAYYKNYFDRISADIAFLSGIDTGSKKPKYKTYYKEKAIKPLYGGIPDSEAIIEKAYKLRNENPLSHSSARIIDSENTSDELETSKEELDFLIDQLSKTAHLKNKYKEKRS